VEIRAGIPEPITGPAVGAIEVVTSIVSSFVTLLESPGVLSRCWADIAGGSTRNRRSARSVVLGTVGIRRDGRKTKVRSQEPRDRFPS
jgi:hypothetical protein